jgi:hypothetical protein
MDCGLRDAYDFHHKPVFLQEWADYWNSGANQQVEAAYLQSMYAVWGQLVRESKWTALATGAAGPALMRAFWPLISRSTIEARP